MDNGRTVHPSIMQLSERPTMVIMGRSGTGKSPAPQKRLERDEIELTIIGEGCHHDTTGTFMAGSTDIWMFTPEEYVINLDHVHWEIAMIFEPKCNLFLHLGGVLLSVGQTYRFSQSDRGINEFHLIRD